MSAASSTFSLCLVFLLSLSLCFVLLPSPSLAQDLTAEDLTIVAASGDGTCVNTGLVALNCTLPFTLTLTVVNFLYPQSIPIYSIILSLSVDTTRSASTRFDASSFNASSTSLPFYLGFGPLTFPQAAVVSVSLRDTRNGSILGDVNSPQPYAAFSLMSYPQPYVSSVSGCQYNPNPLLTLNCQMDVDTLTVTGGNFAQLSSFLVYTDSNVTGFRGTQLSPSSAGVTLNDTVITLSLSDSFGYLITAAHYRGLIVSIYLSWGGGRSATFNITLLPPPMPIVSSLSVGNQKAVIVGNMSTYPFCVPGIDSMIVYGKWLYDVNVSVGSYPCTTNMYSTAVSYQCLLPIIEPYVSGAMYDVTVQNEQAVIVLPAAIGFTSQPSLAAVSICWQLNYFAVNGNPLSRCMAGDTLTITGRRFMQQSTALVNVTFITQPSPISGGSPFTFACLTPTILSDTSIACVLPSINRTGIFGQPLTIGTAWSDGYSSNQLATRYIYDWPYAPRIASVEGCGMSSDLTSGLSLHDCQQGETITLRGTNFDIAGSWQAQSIYNGRPSWYCASLAVLSNDTITCQLATEAEYSVAVYGLPYTLFLRPINPPGYGFASNTFNVSFAPSGSSSSSSSSSGAADGGSEGSSARSMTVAIVASVLGALAVIAVLAGGWYYYYRTGCPQTGPPTRRSTDEAEVENADRATGGSRWGRLFPSSSADSAAEVELE